ncbi:cytochrome P450 [Comamonas sp. GB3 AK4-5]|uniref:cytochrome P450 n=1 Tax=Comamonas sp. GB3 AK4-5 TaxID=3231487 RepID=UPI00351E506D
MAGDMLGTLSAWQRRYGDVFHVRTWPEHQVMITDPALVRELLVGQNQALIRWEHGLRVLSQLHGRSVLISEGEAWRSKRQALVPLFAPKAMQARVPELAMTIASALDTWPSQAEDWPVEEAITALTMDIIMRLVFSLPIGEHGAQAQHSLRVLSHAADREFYWRWHWPDFMPWKKAKRETKAWLHGFIDRQVQARLQMKEGPEDLLGRLLALHREQPQTWSLQAVRDECMTAFLAGHETVASTLTWWAWCMAAHPEAQQAAAQEVAQQLQGRQPTAQDLAGLHQLNLGLQETMRLYPAAPLLLSRRSTQPIALGPWRFPARTMFMLPLGLMQRDARWFPEPDAFRPERFEAPMERGSFMPFGAGPRVCLGQHLASTEMVVIAAMLLQRFVLQPLPGAQPPQPRLHITLRPATPLRLRLRRRGVQN